MNKLLTLQPDIAFEKDDFIKIGAEDLRADQCNKDNIKDSRFSRAADKLIKNKAAMISICVILILALFAFLGPLASKYTYYDQLRGMETYRPALLIRSERTVSEET
jgi:ABC-type antimicrobial peptide transport system permease subunit